MVNVIREMQIKTTMRGHLTATGMVRIKKQKQTISVMCSEQHYSQWPIGRNNSNVH